MRTTLLLCLVSVSSIVTLLSLIIVHSIVQKQIRSDISADLLRSIATYRNLQMQRQQMLQREVSLLAALPVLKSLLTTADARTIEDGAIDFYKLSGGDFFALADGTGRPVVAFEGGASWPEPSFAFPLYPLETDDARHYLLARGTLYEVAVQPVNFGPAASGTRLGYVLLGYAVNRHLAEEVSQVASAAVIFYADGRMVATTLDQAHETRATNDAALVSGGPADADVWLGHERFVHASTELSGQSDPDVRLVVLKSYDEASKYLSHLNKVMLALGGALLVLSGVLAVSLATTITRPLDRLVAGARALGAGDFEYQLESTGAQEIQELGEAFDRMRQRLRTAREDLLAAERLATIGQMASSISHDLRHYLSAIYANAEFLGYDSIPAEERLELFSEIRQGIRGMTDLIESLLLFSRTGQSMQVSFESLAFVVDRSLTTVRSHPDAHGVRLVSGSMPPGEVWMDALKIERALFNLLLNSCQAARQGTELPEVRISLKEEIEQWEFHIVDNGPGVPASVRDTMFQPFVSEGKPNGMGLGLALAHKIAQEHGGSVTLAESRPGHTVFELTLSKATMRGFAKGPNETQTRLAKKLL